MINKNCDKRNMANKQQQVGYPVNQNGLNKQQLVLPTKQQSSFQSINYLPNLPLHQNQKSFYKKNKSFIYHTNYVGYQNGYQNNYLNKNFHNYNVKSQNKNTNVNYNRNNHQTSDLKYDSTGNSVTPPTPSSGTNSMNTTDSSSSNSSTNSNIITSSSQSQNNGLSQVPSNSLTNNETKQNSNLNRKSELNNSNNETQTINELTKDLNNLNVSSQNKPTTNDANKSNSLKSGNGNNSNKQINSNELSSSNGTLNKVKNFNNNYKLKATPNNKYTQNKNYQNSYPNNYNGNANTNGNSYYNKLNNYNIAANFRSKKHLNNIHLPKNNSNNQSNLPNFKNVNVHSKQVHQQNLHKNYYEGISSAANGNPSVPTNSHSVIPQFIPSNAFLYSFPQYLSNHQHITPQSSQNQSVSNIQQNCLECCQQQNAYYNGNNFIAANYPFATSLLPLQPYSIPPINPNAAANNTNNQITPHGVNPEMAHFIPQFQYNYMHFIPQNFIPMHNNESQPQQQCSNQNSTSSNQMANLINQQTNGQSQQESFVNEIASQANNSLDNSRPSSSYEYVSPENANNYIPSTVPGQNQISYNECFNNANNNGRHFYSPCYPFEFNGNMMFWSNQNNPNTVSGDLMSSHNLIMVNYPCDNTSNGYSSNNVSSGTNFQTETYEKK